MDVWMYGCMDGCMHWMYVCMDAWMDAYLINGKESGKI
jgi:hypothetical protein